MQTSQLPHDDRGQVNDISALAKVAINRDCFFDNKLVEAMVKNGGLLDCDSSRRLPGNCIKVTATKDSSKRDFFFLSAEQALKAISAYRLAWNDSPYAAKLSLKKF